MSNFSMNTEQDISFRLYGWQVSEQREQATVFLGMGSFPLSADVTMTPTEARRLAAMLCKAAAEAEGVTERMTREETIRALLAASGPQDLEQIKRELQTQNGDYADPRGTLADMVAHGLIDKAEEADTWESRT